MNFHDFDAIFSEKSNNHQFSLETHQFFEVLGTSGSLILIFLRTHTPGISLIFFTYPH
jgi:hypothetical protein